MKSTTPVQELVTTGRRLGRQARRQIRRTLGLTRPPIRSKPPGLSPGSLVYVGDAAPTPTRITVFVYHDEVCEERVVEKVSDLDGVVGEGRKLWINIDGVHDAGVIEEIGRRFDVHPLVLEDVMHTNQRAKIEDFGDRLFVVLRMFVEREGQGMANEQVSFLLGQNLLITFQESVGDVFDPVRERLRKGGPKMRLGGIDYLAYALIDAVVDHYFHLLELVGEELENLEVRLVDRPQPADLAAIHQHRRDLIFLRKSVWPLREVLGALQRNEAGLIQGPTLVYLRDVYDHTIQVIDTLESYRDLVMGMLDLYMSSISLRMNEVMKVLTLIATIFIPLTFLAGIYGMNFERFPELQWSWMYPGGFWVFVVVMTAGMLGYFKWKTWL